jgi:hypothetical protein
MADFRVHNQKKQAALLAEEGLTAVILYGKYSMRIYLDRCREKGFKSDVIGIYNEWTFAAAQPFDLCGIILEQAEPSVRGAVNQLLEELDGKPAAHLRYTAAFVPEEKMHFLKVADLANQLLFEQP